MRAFLLVGLAAILAVALACGGAEPPDAPHATPATAETEAPPITATEAPTPAETPLPATGTAAADEREVDSFEIVTLLPKDAIPAIDHPAVISATAADEQLRASDLVIGVSIGDEHRAYGVAFLSGHEIVNDMLGGTAIAVTW